MSSDDVKLIGFGIGVVLFGLVQIGAVVVAFACAFKYLGWI